jgi:hypothetical protein
MVPYHSPAHLVHAVPNRPSLFFLQLCPLGAGTRLQRVNLALHSSAHQEVFSKKGTSSKLVEGRSPCWLDPLFPELATMG